MYASPYKRTDTFDFEAAEKIIDIFEKEPYVFNYKVNYVKNYFHLVNWDLEFSKTFRLKVFETYDQPRQAAMRLTFGIGLMFYIIF